MADAKDAKPATYEAPKELEQKAAVQKFQGRPKRQPVDQAAYFYDVRKTHIVFFVCSLALLGSFVAMFHKDYDRNWKEYQDQFARMDFEMLWSKLTELRSKGAEDRKRVENLKAQIEACLKAFGPGNRVVQLPITVFDEKAALRSPAFGDPKEPQWKTVTVEVDHEAQKLAIAEKEKIRGAKYKAAQDYNFAKDELGTKRFHYEDSKHHLEVAEKEGDSRRDKFEQKFKHAAEEYRATQKKVADAKVVYDRLNEQDAFYDDLATALESRPVKGVWEGTPLADLKKEIGQIQKEIVDRESRFEKERPNLANAVRNKPMLDFIDPTFKVKQQVLGDLKDQLNFTKVEKVDRCTTCHVGVANPDYAVWIDPKAEDETKKYVFKEPFLRKFVDHALGEGKAADCEICDEKGRKTDDFKKQMPAPRTAHGAWGKGDAVKFTKAFMAHPRLELYVGGGSKHPLDKVGCTICHEGDGRDTDFSRVVHMPDDDKEGQAWKARHGTPYGEEHYNWNYRELWDLPMIRTKFLQMSCRRCHKDAVELDGGEKYTAGMKLFERVGCYGCHRTESNLILNKDKSNPATPEQVKARRPGPPLTRIAAKVDEAWAMKWVLEPRGFRPTTRMPHFFGQSNARAKVNGNPYRVYTTPEGKRRSEVDDAVVFSMVSYLWNLSEKQDADPAPPASLKGDAGRGASLVAQAGCMACHSVKDIPQADFAAWKDKSRYLGDFGPSLAAVGSKLKSRTWLYHWVRDPKKHFKDSAMPRLRLTEQEAVDVVEYLMSLKNEAFEKDPAPAKPDEKLVNDLLLELLKAKMPAVDADRAVAGAHPGYPELASADGRLRFLGFRMVKNYGCYSCHELKNEEKGLLAARWDDEEGIGVELTGAQPWGIKHWDRLDFGFTANDHVSHRGVTFKHAFTGEEITKAVNINRQDWLATKLENPRVFDGGKMDSKPWDELLRMPNFALTPYEIELLQTFVLSFTDHEIQGLVEGGRKRPKPEDLVKNRGDRIARDNNCAACHRLALDRFEVEVSWTDPVKKKPVTGFKWVEGALTKATPQQALSYLQEQGFLGKDAKAEQAEKFVVARIEPAVHHQTLSPDPFGTVAQRVVHDGRDWWYLEEAAGKTRRMAVRRHVGQDGGDVIPHITAYKRELEKAYQKAKADGEKDLEKEIAAEKDPKKKKEMEDNFDDILSKRFPLPEIVKNDPQHYEVRYPPMLRTQGVKTQPDWLFGFLKNVRPIRPNINPQMAGTGPKLPDLNIRMPSFDFSDEEASALVKWFGARDADPSLDAGWPHTPIPQKDEKLLADRKALHEKLLAVVKEPSKGCASCHYIGGKGPTGDPYKHSPDLMDVEQRIRPRWIQQWVLEPKSVYPGAVMLAAGEVVPDFKTMKPDQQADVIQGLIEVLMNFKRLSSKSN